MSLIKHNETLVQVEQLMKANLIQAEVLKGPFKDFYLLMFII